VTNLGDQSGILFHGQPVLNGFERLNHVTLEERTVVTEASSDTSDYNCTHSIKLGESWQDTNHPLGICSPIFTRLYTCAYLLPTSLPPIWRRVSSDRQADSFPSW
jgi:hypothetical protein